MKHRKTLMAIALSTVVAGGLAAASVAQNSGDDSSLATEVPGPAVGPAGQTGELHDLDKEGKEYTGGAVMFGPFRLLPAGTKFIPRPYTGGKPSEVTQSTNRAAWPSSDLALTAPAGFTEAAASATILDGVTVDSVQFVWTGPTGKVSATITRVPESTLPLDVYLTFSDSPLVITPKEVPDGFAIIEQPRNGAAPNVGYVSTYVRGKLFVLQSPDLGQDRLLELAIELAGSIK